MEPKTLTLTQRFPSLVLTDVVFVPARREPVLHGPAVGGVHGGPSLGPLALHGRARVDAAVHVPLRRAQVGVLKLEKGTMKNTGRPVWMSTTLFVDIKL